MDLQTPQTTVDAIAEAISHEFEDFTYKFHIIIIIFWRVFWYSEEGTGRGSSKQVNIHKLFSPFGIGLAPPV